MGGEEVAVDFIAELEGEAEEAGAGRGQCGGKGLEVHWWSGDVGRHCRERMRSKSDSRTFSAA